MRLPMESVLHYARNGKFTTQIPEFHVDHSFCMRPNSELDTAVELPDEWFYRVKIASGGARLAFRREKSYLHLSEAGWQAMHERMREVFSPCRGTWEEFAAFVEKYQADVRARTERHRAKLLRMANENRYTAS